MDEKTHEVESLGNGGHQDKADNICFSMLAPP